MPKFRHEFWILTQNYTDRIISIAHVANINKEIKVSQEVKIANHVSHLSGLKGKIVRIHIPFKNGITKNYLRVKCEGMTREMDMKVSELIF